MGGFLFPFVSVLCFFNSEDKMVKTNIESEIEF